MIEHNTATIIYLVNQPSTRRNSQNKSGNTEPTEKPIVHNLASIKQFHRSNTTPKFSTFHLDSAKTSIRTDPVYLETVYSAIALTQQSYTKINVKSKRTSTIESLQTLSDDVKSIQIQLNKKLLSRQRYIKLRRYLGTIHLRLTRLIAKIKDRTETRQASMTEFITTSHIDIAYEPELSSDPSEDYRGESD